MKRKIFLLFILLLISVIAFCQSINNYISQQETINFQKLYLHTDRDHYFIGDTIWFAPYILSAKNNTLEVTDCNLNVELINNNGQIVDNRKFFLDKGICSGYISLNTPSVNIGTYLIRAYTDKMRILGENYFFHKSIKITHSQPNNLGNDTITNDAKKVYIDFYPEGGFLLNNKANKMAYKVHDENGNPLNIKAKLISTTGDETTIQTIYNGMGCSVFIPKDNTKYKIKAPNYKKVVYKIPEIRQSGAKIILMKETDKSLSLYVSSSENFSTNYYIAIFHHGTGLNYININPDRITQPISINKNYLGNGINRLVLLNDQYTPISERLVFINKAEENYPVNIRLNNNKFTTRDKINMDINIPNIKNNQEWARVSVSVINSNMQTYTSSSSNIKSYLLIDSELKGHIQNPGLYFIDDSISSYRKLDLLMLTNGWRNYIWNDLNTKSETKIPLASSGFSFSGNVQKEIANKPLIGTNVFLTISNKNISDIKSTTTDKNGYYKFDSIVFTDTTIIMLQAQNAKGKSNTRISLNEIDFNPYPFDKTNNYKTENIGKIPKEMYKLKYINEITLREMYPDYNIKLLDEIQVFKKEKDNNDDGHIRIYKPSQSIKLNDTNCNYQSVLQVLSSRFAGVKVINKNKIIIRGEGSLYSSNEALILLDGMPISVDQLDYLSIHDIDVIDVLKGPETAIFGVRGSNGIISIFTKNTIDFEPVPEKIPGTIIKTIQGFEEFRNFYSPSYSEKNIDSDIPDYRETLYWNPSIVVDQENTSVSFFTCDNLANYIIKIEGITSSGKICLGKYNFTVNNRKK